MQGLIKSALISRLIPSKITLGFDKYSARERMSSIFYNKTFSIGYEENVIKRNFELIKFALSIPFKFENLQSKTAFLFSSKEYQNSSLSNSKKNILIIAPHPDDETLGCGGTIFKHKKKGDNVYLAIITSVKPITDSNGNNIKFYKDSITQNSESKKIKRF